MMTWPKGWFGVPALLAGATLLSACATGSRTAFFRNEHARVTSPAHYRAAAMRVEAGVGPGYYLAEPRASGSSFGDERVYALVDVGYANPVFVYVRCGIDDADPGAPEKPYSAQCPPEPGSTKRPRNWSVQVSVPVAFHLLWDPFMENAPIVNTDYEFGLDVSHRRALTRGTELRVGGYVGHISTHIGDEYTIAAREDPANPPFPRINVSYEPWRANAGLRWYGPRVENRAGYRSFNEVAFEIEGSCWLGCGDDPYYKVFPSETDGVDVPPTSEGTEGSLVFTTRRYSNIRLREDGDARDVAPASWDAGLLIGWRRVFPYLPNDEPETSFAPALNVVVGRTFQRSQYHSLPVTAYLRGYMGPNPYGQLRSQREFWLLSAGVRLSH